MYIAIASVIFFAAFAMTVQNGLWANLITLLAIVVGGVAAFGFHQPIVIYIDQQTEGAYTYLIDLPVIWFLFAAVSGVMINLSAVLSKTKVLFNEQVETYAGPAVAALCGYAMMCFAMSTLHAAPLSYDMFGSGYEYGTSPAAAEQKIVGASPLLTPDLAWLSLTQLVAQPAALGGEGFEAKIFASQHGKHRERFSKIDTNIVSRR